MSNGNPKTILVVDDEEALREALGLDLELQGYRVLTAADGAEALTTVLSHSVDLVLSDIRMPVKNGIELLKEIKNHAPDLPVVLVSGFTDLSVEEAYDLGAASFFPKPFDRDKLMATVEKIVARSGVESGTPEPRPFEIRMQVETPHIAAAIAAKIMGIGRGGMFVSLGDKVPPYRGAEIYFQIDFADSTAPSRFSGNGIIRWSRVGLCGIEFTRLDEPSARWLASHLETTRVTAHIPSYKS